MMNFSEASVDEKAARWGALLNGGFIDIYSGAMPAGADLPATGTKLGRLTFGNPAFGAPVSGVITANAITDDASADATDTAGYFRLVTVAEVTVADGPVGLSGSGAEMELDNLSIVVGGRIRCTSFVYSEPK
jgi:hypothetical protein